MRRELNGRSDPELVLVTGAGSGIGKATASRFARQGAKVIVADIDEAAAHRAAEEIDGRAHAYALDVSDAEAWEAFAVRLGDEHGVPDVLVNNAGILIAGAFLGHEADDWERILGVNLMGVVHGCRVIGAQMVERGSGQIVNVASAAAFVPLRSAPAYATTKVAVLMLSECLRIEFAGSGVGVSAICPTVIRTNIAQHSHVAGVDADTEARFVEVGARLQRFSWPGPDKVARAITRAARHDWAIVPVNPDAWLTYFVSRLSPGAVRSLARVASFDVMLRGAMRLFQP